MFSFTLIESNSSLIELALPGLPASCQHLPYLLWGKGARLPTDHVEGGLSSCCWGGAWREAPRPPPPPPLLSGLWARCLESLYRAPPPKTATPGPLDHPSTPLPTLGSSVPCAAGLGCRGLSS